MDIIELRGHHLETIKRYLMRDNPNSLRKTGEWDDSTYIEKAKKFYDSVFAEKSCKVYIQLFRDDPIVKLTDTSDTICKASCPYLVEEEEIECSNPWASLGFDDETLEDITDDIKEGDRKAINDFGFKLGDEKRFSEILVNIIDSCWLDFGYENLNQFKQEMYELFHPNILALYNS